MTRARLVLRAVEDALTALDHHPRLFAEYLQADRSCVAVSRALARYKRTRAVPSSSRPDHDEVERIDGVSEELYADRARERFERRRRSFQAERRADRARMTLLELALAISEGVARLSTVAAGNIEPSRGGDGGIGPPRQQMLEDDPRWLEHEAVAKRRLGAMLDLVKEAEGHGAIENPTMTAEEKDALILSHKMEGKSASQVWDELGTYIAGSSPELVRRKRRAKGLDHLGIPKRDR